MERLTECFIDSDKVRCLQFKGGLNRKMLADASGLCMSTINRLFTFPYCPSKMKTAFAIAKTFNVNASELMVDEGFIMKQRSRELSRIEEAEKAGDLKTKANSMRRYKKMSEAVGLDV